MAKEILRKSVLDSDKSIILCYFTCGRYQKPTGTGTLLIFRSCALLQYKRNDIDRTVHWLFRSTSTWEKVKEASVANQKQSLGNQYP